MMVFSTSFITVYKALLMQHLQVDCDSYIKLVWVASYCYILVSFSILNSCF